MWIADGWKEYEVIDTSGVKSWNAGEIYPGSPGPSGYLGYPRTHRGWKK